MAMTDSLFATEGSYAARLCGNALIRGNLAHGFRAHDHMEVMYAQIHRGTKQAPSYFAA
jgi:hypothetical protein